MTSLDPVGVSAAAKAVYETLPVALKDLVSRADAEAAIGMPHGDGVPDRWIAEAAVRAYLAVAGSPADERPWQDIADRMATPLDFRRQQEGHEPDCACAMCVVLRDYIAAKSAPPAASPADENPWRTSFPPGRLDAPLKADVWGQGFAAGWDNGWAAENARIVAALRAKGTHAADVLADQIEGEAP